MILATWNVLHRVHAENWQEPAIAAHPDETARIAAIAARIAGLAADVIVLQEVSGDQLAALAAACPPPATIVSAPYPRVPRPRAPAAGGAGLADPTEHLVTIVRAGAARVVEAVAFDDDRGKGYLAVDLPDGVLAINTHVTYGDRRRGQLRRIAARAAGAAGVVIAGDFNADRAAVTADLGPELVLAAPAEPALPTRPRPDGASKSSTIDHVLARGLRCLACDVVDAGGLSDHNLVVARLSAA